MNCFLRSSLVAFGVLVSSPSFAATISSTFDNGDEGWQVGNLRSPSGAKTAPIYNATGGHPGGYISTTDVAQYVGFFAPSTYDGNKSSFYGGSISFDLQDKVPADGTAYPALFLYGDGKVVSISAGVPQTTFTSFSFSLTETGFVEYDSHGNTTPVSKADFEAILGNLTNVAILADWHTGRDRTGLDNVLVSTGTLPPSTVPLPASAPMFGATLLVLGALGYGLKRRKETVA